MLLGFKWKYDKVEMSCTVLYLATILLSISLVKGEDIFLHKMMKGYVFIDSEDLFLQSNPVCDYYFKGLLHEISTLAFALRNPPDAKAVSNMTLNSPRSSN
jgi:hypothetical protein